jgi:peptidyl-prolyl cis-trans isomerase D
MHFGNEVNMFEYIRNHQRLMQFLLMLIIVPSFAAFGIQGYSRFFGDQENALAMVGDHPITQQEFDAIVRAQGDPRVAHSAEAKQRLLDIIINERTLETEAARNHLTVPNSALQQAIMSMEGLTGPDGKFDKNRYETLLSYQGMTPAIFEAKKRGEMSAQLLSNAVETSGFVPKTVAERLAQISEQEREVQQLTLKADDFRSQVKVTDAMLKDYYDKHPDQYAVPEQAKIEYVVLSDVSDDDLKAYYEKNKDKYSTEERRASHILITVDKKATDADKAAAKAKAEKLLAEARKNPKDFAKLAKENSQDAASAEKGGDLDYFGRGMMVKPFEDTVFKMKQGDIELVQSEFGYHVIQLTGIKPGQVKPLQEVKSQVASDYKRDNQIKDFGAKADAFRDTVYEQADSLKPAADKFKLTIETAANVTRVPNPALPPDTPYNNPKFLKALFSPDSVKSKHNTEAVEVAPNTFISGRIVDYKPASTRPFEEVKNQVTEQVTKAEEAKLAKQAGEAKLAALKAKDDPSAFGPAKKVSRAKHEGLAGNEYGAVMKADTSKLPAFVGVENPAGGYSIFRIAKVEQPATVDAARRQADRQMASSIVAQQETLDYIEALKKKNKVKILKPIATKTESDDGNQ